MDSYQRRGRTEYRFYELDLILSNKHARKCARATIAMLANGLTWAVPCPKPTMSVHVITALLSSATTDRAMAVKSVAMWPMHLGRARHMHGLVTQLLKLLFNFIIVQTSCISSSAIHRSTVTDYMVEEVYKSCSPIIRPAESCYGSDFENNDGTVHFDVCKTQCQTDACNSVTLHAQPDTTTTENPITENPTTENPTTENPTTDVAMRIVISSSVSFLCLLL